MDLASWHQRLREHFLDLKNERADSPVFALEHGLNEEDLKDLNAAAIASLNTPHRFWRLPHWLPWIVYSTEIGYRYAGEEYWQTFGEETPRWGLYGDRTAIRRWFEKFNLEFNGFRPEGPFTHFSIICWPISHAILPQDLQRQLAQLLYDLRHSFKADVLSSPHQLGEQIAANSWRFASRFQNLAQEKRLIGQIAAALLEGGEGDKGLILPDTLRRIVQDLERERQARSWLRGAQKAAQRTRLKGLRKGGAHPGDVRARERKDSKQHPTSGIRFFLQQSGEQTWSFWLETPDLSFLLGTSQLSDAILRARVRILGSRGTHPRGFLLGGTRRIRIDTWPSKNAPLVAFDPSSPELDFVVTSGFLAPAASMWVFRIQKDGIASHVKGNAIRPGTRLVLVFPEEHAYPIGDLPAIQLNCQGAKAFLLEVPEPLTRQAEEALSGLGLTATRTLEAWPAGQPAVFWDREGTGEWLSTDHPCLGLRVEPEVDAFTVRILNDATPPTLIEVKNPTEAIFLEIDGLEPGLHSLEFNFKSAYPQFDGKTASLGIFIREPRPWEPGHNPQHPLIVLPDPPSPSLDELWDGRATLVLRGPSNHEVGCSLKLATSGGNKELARKTGPKLRLPIDGIAWKRYFSTHFQQDVRINSVYDASRVATLDIDGNELGKLSIRCEKEFTAVKWVFLPGHELDRLFLLNDTEAEVSQAVAFGFQQPDEARRLSIGSNSETSVPAEGSLFVAQIGARRVGIVAPPKNVRFLDQFHVDPRLQWIDRTPEALAQLVRLFELWEAAQQTGDLVGRLRRLDVLLAILQKLFTVICGKEWAATEKAGLNQQRTTRVVETLIRGVSARAVDRQLLLELERMVVAFPPLIPEERAAIFGTVVTRYVAGKHVKAVWGEHAAQWMAGFAMRLASGAPALSDWAKPNLLPALELLLRVPLLARAARSLILGSHRIQQEESGTWALYEGWEWE